MQMEDLYIFKGWKLHSVHENTERELIASDIIAHYHLPTPFFGIILSLDTF